MAIVQSLPTGYLSLLGIKQGNNPGQSADFVQPVLSVDTFYLATNLASSRVITNLATNVGDSAINLIPTGEAWRLLAVSADVTDVTGPITIDVSLMVIDRSTGIGVTIGNFRQSIAAVGDIARIGVSFPQPVVLPPGTMLRSYLNNDLGAETVSLSNVVLFQRLVV